MVRLILAVVAAVSLVASVHADALNLLRAGLAARVRGDFNTAIAYYTQAIDTGELTQSQLTVVLNSRGVAYDFTGELDKAIADFNAAIRINANYGEAYINRGLAWVKKRDYDRGLADFTAATRDEKFAFLAFNNRANIYADKHDYVRAIEDYSEAIRLRPEYADAYYGRANVYGELGEAEKALADFNATIGARPDFQSAYVNRSVLKVARGDPDGAIADLDVAAGLNPNDAMTFSNRAYAYQVKGEYGRAIPDLDQAVRLNPFGEAVYLKRGVARLYLGRTRLPSRTSQPRFASELRTPMQSSGFILLAYVRDRMTGRNLPEMRPTSIARSGRVRLSTGIWAHRAMILSAVPPYRMEMRRNARELVKLNSISPSSTLSSAHEKKHNNTSGRQKTFVPLVELSSSRCEPQPQKSSRIGDWMYLPWQSRCLFRTACADASRIPTLGRGRCCKRGW
jgi:tetratricopeptide (TPR) repeat protein